MTIYDFLIILLVVLVNLSFILSCCVLSKKGDEEIHEEDFISFDSDFWDDSNS